MQKANGLTRSLQQRDRSANLLVRAISSLHYDSLLTITKVEVLLKFCNLQKIPINLLERALPAVYLALACHVLPASRLLIEWSQVRQLMVDITMLVYIVSRITKHKGIEHIRALPYYSAFEELRDALYALCDKAEAVRSRTAPSEITIHETFDDFSLKLIMILGLRVTRRDLGDTPFPGDLEAEFGSKGFLPTSVESVMKKRRDTELQTARFWEKDVIICSFCGRADVDIRFNKAVKGTYQRGGCCGILAYCNSKCAQEHWKSHKHVCWTRRKQTR